MPGRLGLINKAQVSTIAKINNNLNQVIKQGRMLPVPIANLQATSNLKTRGAQISFQVISLQGIDSFVLMRNFSADPGSAQQITVWSAASLVATPQTYPLNLQYMDADPAIAQQTAYYWVKVVPSSNATQSNTFVSGPQVFDASQQPSALQITGDYPICQAYTPTTQPLSAVTGSGANEATIDVAAFQIQYPFSTTGSDVGDLISYSSGTITPLDDDTQYYVYFNDPTYSGGAQTYIANTNNPDVTAGLYRQYLGSITTPNFGGGGTGGHGGGAGPGGYPCFSGNTLIRTRRGMVPISQIVKGDRVYSRNGWREVQKLLVHDYDGPMIDMGAGELVTPGHRMYARGKWLAAEQCFSRPADGFKGLVFNLELMPAKSDNGRCYLLANGWIAHNALKTP